MHLIGFWVLDLRFLYLVLVIWCLVLGIFLINFRKQVVKNH
jgi:hypothetical protein